MSFDLPNGTSEPKEARHPYYLKSFDWLVNSVISCVGGAKIETPDGYIAVDTHIHSNLSRCSLSSIQRILLHSAEIGLGGVAIMDHNDLQSAEFAFGRAEDLKRQGVLPNDFVVIPGMEIGSAKGHVGALFLKEAVPSGLDVAETVRRIHSVNGLAVAVHPYLKSGIGDALFDAPFDAVEIESGSVLNARAMARTKRLVDDDRLKDAAMLGSSDAHYLNAIGGCYTLIKVADFDLESVRSAIEAGECIPRATTTCLRFRKALGRLPTSR